MFCILLLVAAFEHKIIKLNKIKMGHENLNTPQNPKLSKGDVMPRLFFVVARTSEEEWQQLSVGLPTYERAVAFRDEPFTKKRYPYAFVVCTINEV